MKVMVKNEMVSRATFSGFHGRRLCRATKNSTLQLKSSLPIVERKSSNPNALGLGPDNLWRATKSVRGLSTLTFAFTSPLVRTRCTITMNGRSFPVELHAHTHIHIHNQTHTIPLLPTHALLVFRPLGRGGRSTVAVHCLEMSMAIADDVKESK